MRPLALALACLAAGACTGSPSVGGGAPRSGLEICDNGRDDDGDRRVDCDDRDCGGATACFRCGDGVRQLAEVCDGKDLGGDTCVARGYERGTLRCTAACELDLRDCAYPPENCSASGDEDRDGEADCADADCALRPSCQSLVVDAPESGFAGGRVEATFTLRDGRGQPVADVALALEVPEGAGVLPDRPRTAKNGEVRATLRLSPSPGDQTFQVLLERDRGVTFSVEAEAPPAGTILPVAGAELQEGDDADGPAASAHIGAPVDLALADDGTLYVAERCRILAVSPRGVLSRVAGTGTCGDPGPFVERGDPITVGGIAWHDGALYASSPAPVFAGRILRIDPATGTGETFAGGGSASPEAGHGGPATEMRLDTPGRPRVGPGPSLWFADPGLSRVLSVDLADGTIRTRLRGVPPVEEPSACAGEVALITPELALPDGQGSVFVSGRVCGTAVGDPWVDPGGIAPVHPGAVRIDASAEELGPSEVTVLGGLLGGRGTTADEPLHAVALPSLPAGAFDAAGNWIVASGNQVLRVDAVHGGVTALAGRAESGSSGDGTPAVDALLSGPAVVIVDPSGDVLVADAGNFAVRRVVGVGESERRAVRIAQEVPLPEVEFMQWVDLSVYLLDSSDRPLPRRTIALGEPTLSVHPGDPAPTEETGATLAPVRGTFTEGAASVQASLEGIHGDRVSAPLRLTVKEPAPGTIFTVLRREDLPPPTRSSETELGTFAVASDGSLYVSSTCRVLRFGRDDTFTRVAGREEGCWWEGPPPDSTGPILGMPAYGPYLLLDEAQGRVYVNGSGDSTPVSVADLDAATTTYAGAWGGPLALDDGGRLLAARSRQLLELDLETPDTTVRRELPATTCEESPAAPTSLWGPPVRDGNGWVVLATFCEDAADRRMGAIRWPDGGDPQVLLRGGRNDPKDDGTLATACYLEQPRSVTVDPQGRLVVADGNRILRVEDGAVHVLTGDDRTAPDHVPALESGVGRPDWLRYDAAGHLWFLDGGAVRVIW